MNISMVQEEIISIEKRLNKLKKKNIDIIV